MISFALQLAQKQGLIEDWFSTQWQRTPPPFYTSVDLRENEFKLAPVDTNLFPAGFNNLAFESKNFAIQAFKKTLANYTLKNQSILLIPENHTQNLFYLDNLANLQSLLKEAGFEVRLGTLESHLSRTYSTASQQSIQLEPITRTANQLHIGSFTPDLILLNNDLSTGIPSQLLGLSQTLVPSLNAGWHQRLKSNHFHHYANVCQEFANQFDLDTWHFNPLFQHCDHVNFINREGFSCLQSHTETLLNEIQKEYNAHQLTHTPYIVIKADSGSYGMGVLMIDNPEELNHLSRKKRQHMAKTKGNRVIQKVILQEGITSTTQFKQMVAEPVIYLIGSEVIGGFYRTHTGRSAKENLNTPGMQLHSFVLKKLSSPSSIDLKSDSIAIQHYAYSVIARLAALAAAHELTF